MSRDIDLRLHNMERQIAAAHAKLNGLGQASHNGGAQSAAVQRELQQQRQELQQFQQTLARLQAKGSGDPDHIRYIEQIPGRRIPFDMMVQIPIGSNVTAQQQASTTISQDGPFVAVARYATFQSAYTFSVDDGSGNTSTFQGRSYGRLRPIHSAWDLNDGQAGYQPVVGAALPGGGQGIYASPSNHSSFRTMQFDGNIEFQNQGAGFRRQNIPLPSSFYTTSINEPFALGALDFFERGEVVEWKVTPLHVNNPPAGNVSGYAAGGFYPFLDSQYDVHEGILDPVVAEQQTDLVRRLPEGILTIGFHGYRIIQPPGPVSMT